MIFSVQVGHAQFRHVRIVRAILRLLIFSAATYEGHSLGITVKIIIKVRNESRTWLV